MIGIANATQVSAGANHTCALLQDNTIKCWGYGYEGQLGDGQYQYSLTPVTVIGIANATQVSAGDYHTCALLQDSTIKCWGKGQYGQLGNGQRYLNDPYGFATPVTVSGISNATQVSPRGDHTCALLQDSTIKCWGDGRKGQIGDPRLEISTTLVTVIGISNATQVSAGNRHTCALLQDSTIKCWGEGGSGQLGDGVRDGVLKPPSTAFPTTVIQIPDDGGSPITSYTATAVEDPTKSCTVLAPVTSCTITGLAPGSYTFTVTATNAVGTSFPSAPSDPVTIP